MTSTATSRSTCSLTTARSPCSGTTFRLARGVSRWPSCGERIENMAERYVIGIDGGTESLRAEVFNLQGQPRGFGSSPYSTIFRQPSWAEQNPDDWWRALGWVVLQAVQAAKIRTDEVAALSV